MKTLLAVIPDSTHPDFHFGQFTSLSARLDSNQQFRTPKARGLPIFLLAVIMEHVGFEPTILFRADGLQPSEQPVAQPFLFNTDTWT